MLLRLLVPLLLGLALAGGLVYALRQEESAPAAARDGDETIDRMLRDSEGLVAEAYDERALRVLVAKAGVDLTPEQTQAVLPLLHAHLVGLRRNLRAARDAGPQANAASYYVAAAKAHGDFQRALRKIVAPEQAKALFDAFPALMPPRPEPTRDHPDPSGGAPAPVKKESPK